MSTDSQWRYLINTFDVNTRTSNVRMLNIAAYTYAKLKAEESDPAIADILTIYEPVYFAYRDLCEQYGVKSGEWEGTTLGWEQYLDQMPLKLRQWESLIRAVYIEDSPQERAIFPDKRKPFESGPYVKRLEALGSLKLKLDADVALATAAAQVTSFYNAASGARLVQMTTEGALGQLSDLREDQRLLLAEELQGVLGTLMFIHRHNIDNVTHYFRMGLLRDTGGADSVRLNGLIMNNTILNLNPLIDAENITLGADTVIRMKNTSGAGIALIFYSTSNATFPPGAGAQFTVNPGETLDKTVAELNLIAFPFFNIQNNNPFNGSWEIEIIL